MSKAATFIFLFFALLVAPGLYAQRATEGGTRKVKPDKHSSKLDGIFLRSIRDFNVPGMAVAIVKDNEVVLAKGYGVKKVGTMQKVDANTLFAIASNTKSFTAAALAMLIDEGALTWDDKVRDYLPYFEMYSPYVTSEMTIRDLLCHRSGLATFSGDLIWYGTSHSREEVIKRARYLEPKLGFREGYGYSNIMFLAAGEIVAKVSGKSWDQYIREKIFTPLEMNNTNTSIRDFQTGGNIAAPHNEVNGKNIAIEYVNWDNIGPAGSINSSVNDMTQWLKLQLGKGKFEGQRFWKEQRAFEMWENLTPKPVSKWQRDNMPSRHFNGYGLGWELMDYEGYKVISHGGGYDGMISKTVLVPELNLGFVILTNNISSVPTCLTYEILDEYCGVKKQKDWLKIFLEFKKQDEKLAALAKKADEESRVNNTKPSLDLSGYCGLYESKMYGGIEVAMGSGGNLMIDFKPTALFKGELVHWHFDTFQLVWSTQMMLPPGKVTFVLGADGKPEEMRVIVENPDFDFTELKLVRRKDNKQ